MYAAHNTWSMIRDGMYWAGCVCWLPMYDVIAITLTQYAIHSSFVAHNPIVVEFIYGCSFTFNSGNALNCIDFVQYIHISYSYVHSSQIMEHRAELFIFPMLCYMMQSLKTIVCQWFYIECVAAVHFISFRDIWWILIQPFFPFIFWIFFPIFFAQSMLAVWTVLSSTHMPIHYAAVCIRHSAHLIYSKFKA